MSYYDTIEEDLARAKAILERGKAEDGIGGGGGTVYGSDTYAAYKLLESFVAEIARLRLDQRMLADTVRRTVIALGDVGEDWEGTVAEGVELINANVARVNERLHHEGIEHTECQEALVAAQARYVTLATEVARFYSLFSDYEAPCESYDHAQAIWNAMKERENRLHEKIRQLEASAREVAELHNPALLQQMDQAVRIAEQAAEIDRLRALVDAVGEDVCKTALRLKQRLHDHP